MRVILNAESVRSPLTGIGAYTAELIRALHEQGVDTACFHPAAGGMVNRLPAFENLPDGRRARFLRGIPSARSLERRIGESRFRRATRHEPRGTLYHEPRFTPYRYPGPTVVTIHDLAWVRHPETHPPGRVRYLDRHVPRALKRADHLLTVSAFTRDELIDVYGIERSRITVTPLGVDRERFYPRPDYQLRPVLERYGLQPGKYFLGVGTLEPRKNLPLAIEAHARLPAATRRAFPLVLAGADGWRQDAFSDILERERRKGHLLTLGFVPSADLPALYAGARVFVYPSRYEGFGLPPLEAMASGTPSIVSHARALVDVADKAALIVDPDDPDALAEHLQDLVENKARRRSLIEAGHRRAAQFSWADCAHRTLDGYRRALRGDSGDSRPASDPEPQRERA